MLTKTLRHVNLFYSLVFVEITLIGPLLDKLMFVVVGARDFSPEITVHIIGTEVPCPDKVHPLGMNHSVAYNLPEST